MSKIPVPIKTVIGNIGYFLFKDYMKITHRKPIVLNEDKTVQYIIQNKCSVSRYGDGELLWAFQERKDDNFEKNSPELAKRLLEIVKTNRSNLIICIPDIFDNLNDIKKKARTYWEGLLIKHGFQILNILDLSKTYFDSKFTRPYIDYLSGKRDFKKKFNNLKKIWNNRNLLIVEGSYSRFGVGSDLLTNARSVKRIICPSENAFEKYHVIYKNVKRIASQMNDVLVLIALGPTATVLAYDLTPKGIQAVDIGHLDVEYEWYKMKAKTKVPIRGRYVNEADQQVKGKLLESDYRKYKEEIILDIS